jgi:uncharacterized membrane protein YgdD (TMEM256/DUF423 family)
MRRRFLTRRFAVWVALGVLLFSGSITVTSNNAVGLLSVMAGTPLCLFGCRSRAVGLIVLKRLKAHNVPLVSDDRFQRDAHGASAR